MSDSVIDSERAASVQLTADELARYSRHLALPNFGAHEQLLLKSARVLCIGAGGLGSPAALYLAAAGVGTLGIIDADTVDVTNLQRQILHGNADVGRKKVDSARERLLALNPSVNVLIHNEELTRSNAVDLVEAYDIVLDGSDNLRTRYLSNDICVQQRRPNIYAAVSQFEAQVSLFAPHLGGPCYRCLFPHPPPPGSVPGCAEAGVLGVVPGIAGTIQATEAIKLLLGIGEPLIGRMLHIDAATMRFREIKLRRDSACPTCGPNPSAADPREFENVCDDNGSKVPSITVQELKERIDAKSTPKIVDVREGFEFEIARIQGSELIPLGQLPDRLNGLSRDEEIVVMCKSGVRSAHAVEFMQRAGFTRARNLEGGIDAWREQIDPTLLRY